MRLHTNIQGQGTVEAAFVTPIVFVLMLLLLQPSIMLYDYVVMCNAAAEGARLAATTNESDLSSSCEEFIRHRLSAIPQQNLFHVHEESCSWVISIKGGEAADCTEVRIENQLRPLPLFDATLSLLGATNSSGNIELSVCHIQRNQPEWVASSAPGTSSDWVEEWLL